MPHPDMFSIPFQDPIIVFAMILFVILLAPPLFKKIHMPSVVGLILSGVLIGPYALNIIERNEAIILFGTVGLIYIMFLAGLELDLNDFKRNKYRSLLFGSFTFSIPFSLGVLACIYVLKLPILASVLVSSMFATHTLVSYPIASRLGINKNEAVTITVGGTIITDTLVLLILAVITAFSHDTLDVEFWLKWVIKLLLFSGAIFYGFPKIGHWFFKSVNGEKTSRYIFVLAMVFLAALLAELAGVEAIIGAFMAGLALNRLIPHTSPLMNRIEFVGNALFIPFFLINVGMMINLNVVFAGPRALQVAIVLTLVALITKWIASLITQKILGYTRDQRQVMFGLSSAHAAATLAVILVGFNLGIINESILNGTILLILVTCVVSAFVTERAGKRIAIQTQSETDNIPYLPEKIIIPLANPEHIELLLDFAVLIKEPKSENPLYPLTVTNDNNDSTDTLKQSALMLEQACKHVSSSDTPAQPIKITDISVASGIIQASRELKATDIILGSPQKQRTINRLFGSMMDQLLQSVWQTVFACRFTQPLNTLSRVIIAVPHNAELEIGFDHWMEKMQRFIRQVNSKPFFFCTPKTAKLIQSQLSPLKIDAKYKLYRVKNSFSRILKEIGKDDLLIIINARQGAISYDHDVNQLGNRMLSTSNHSGVIVIYPECRPETLNEEPEDSALIRQPVELVDHLQKRFKKYLKTRIAR